MARHSVSDTSTTVTINGVSTEVYQVTGLQSQSGSLNLRGVTLRRELRGENEVKIRPTNVTATVIIQIQDSTGTNSEIVDEIIMLHNGTKGGFSQYNINIGAVLPTGYDSYNVYVNGAVASLYAN